MTRLVIVTATTDLRRADACLNSWLVRAAEPTPIVLVENGDADTGYLGTVTAFRRGIDQALAKYPTAAVIACFHDDLEIHEVGWDQKVLRHFTHEPACGLAGFGGAIGLGSPALYHDPYDPMQLARVGFRSNLIDAEAHGMRSLLTERVACLDGFSQIGRREFWEGFRPGPISGQFLDGRPWTVLESLGVIHHFYDSMLGCLARRYGWDTWYLPVACRHYGGRTAVGDPGYQHWINDKTQSTEGDHEVWKAAHRLGYEEFRDVLPLRV
jgi:hypothetical protein